jgi:hypothetical protein
MSDTLNTPYLTKCEILSELWLNYRNDEEFVDFIEYADLGLPLAYAISNGIVESSPIAENFINETFELLLGAMDLTDTGFETLNDILEQGSIQE